MTEHFPTREHLQPVEPDRSKPIFDRAAELYDQDARYQRFVLEFTKDELIELWNLCCRDLSVGFDDEVYDALHMEYGYFDDGDAA